MSPKQTIRYIALSILLILGLRTTVQGQVAPDLMITDVWQNGTQIWYQIFNDSKSICPANHETHLLINGKYVTKDVITDQIGAFERKNYYFSKFEWQCSGTSQPITVVADGDSDITEKDENNNSLSETWYCDQDAPVITEGPTVHNIDKTSVMVHWKTDEPTEGTVYFHNKPGFFYESHETALLTEHDLYIANLSPATTYQFKVSSSDQSGNSVESELGFFTTHASGETVPPKVSTPKQMNIDLPVFPLQFNLDAEDNEDIQRVDFELDGVHVMTDFDAPFECFIHPGLMQMMAEAYYGNNHELGATVADLNNNTAMATVGWFADGQCPEMELTVELGESYRVYTPNTSIYNYDLEIQVMARANEGLLLGDTGSGPHHHPGSGGTGVRWGEVDSVEVYLDDDLIDTITPAEDETSFTIPFLMSYIAAPSEHEIRVKIQTGICVMNRYATMRVIHQYTQLTAERTITRDGTSFDVEIVLTNDGTTPAVLDILSEEAYGFQLTKKMNSSFGPTISYDPITCISRYEYNTAISIGGGESRTFRYTAIPILNEYDTLYCLGVNNELRYHDHHGRDYVYPSLDSVTRVDGMEIEDAVAQACEESDYLIVTNPLQLFGIYNDNGSNRLLDKAAELASIRNGIFGYFQGMGSLQTKFRHGDEITAGNFAGNWLSEIILKDVNEDRIRIYDGYHHWRSIEYSGLVSDDGLLVGNFEFEADPSHPEHEIAIVNGHDSAHYGRVTIYQWNPVDERVDEYSGVTNYRPYNDDRLLCGNIRTSRNLDEILVLKGSSGDIDVFSATGGSSYPWSTISTVYQLGDLYACGELVPDSIGDEIAIGDVSANRIYIYLADGTLYDDFTMSMEASDHLAVGQGRLVFGDISAEEIQLRYLTDDGFSWIHRSFDVNLHSDDALFCGNVLDRGLVQYIVARGQRSQHYTKGNVEMYTYNKGSYSSAPRDREYLDDLLDPGGDWAEAMGSNWTSDGYLLIIGETEIIPAYSRSYYLAWNGRQYIEFTDNYYGNISGDMKSPEISVGRIIGNSIDKMIAPIQTSIDVSKGDKTLDFTDAYSISGGPEERFETARHEVVESLEGKGWHVDRNDEPSVATFYSNTRDKDAIYMAGHGNWDHCWVVDVDNIVSDFNPGTHAPVVYGNSCLTGRYPESTYTFGERWLEHGASCYIGATEVSYSPWSRHLSEGFFDRLNWGQPIGRALKESKRNRMGDGDYGRYESAIYHFYGDPKLEAVASSASVMNKASESTGENHADDIIIGPKSSLSVSIPSFTVTATADGDVASIPGGSFLAVPGEPEIPTWPVQVYFPAGTIIQNVVMDEQSVPQSGTSLDLVIVNPNENGTTHEGPDLGDPDVWPNRNYDWQSEKTPDGGTMLTITVYPLHSWPATLNYTWFSNCHFDIDYTYSDITINRLWTDKNEYPYASTEPAQIDLFFMNNGQKAQYVIAEAEFVDEQNGDVIGLDYKYLRDVQPGLASCGWQVVTHNFVGTYDLNVRLRNTEGDLLDEASKRFTVGITEGTMGPLELIPSCFEIGEDIKIHTSFTNTGALPMNARLIVEAQSADGTVLERFVDEATVNGQVTYATHWEWSPTAARGDLRWKTYTMFDGKTTDVTIYPIMSPLADGDLNNDGTVNLFDVAMMADYWMDENESNYDIAPAGGDCTVDVLDIAALSAEWLN